MIFGALFMMTECWGQWTAGPDTTDGRRALSRYFPRATGNAAHNVYYYQEMGFTDQAEYMRFDTNDTTIANEFVAGGGGGRTLRSDTAINKWPTENAPRWFRPPHDARLFDDSAGYYYLWVSPVSPGGHRVWFFFFSH
jgi:hypothetical protein